MGARAGVDWAWLISVDLRMIEVFERSRAAAARPSGERSGSRWLAHSVASGEGAAAIPPFEAAPLDLGLLWAT